MTPQSQDMVDIAGQSHPTGDIQYYNTMNLNEIYAKRHATGTPLHSHLRHEYPGRTPNGSGDKSYEITDMIEIEW